MNIEEVINRLKAKGLDFVILKSDNKFISINIIKNGLTIQNFDKEEDLEAYINL